MSHYPLPQPEELTRKEKEDAMGAYMMMFAAVAVGLPLPIINLLAALIYYFVNKASSRFVHFHSLQSLLSSIPLTLMNGVGMFWSIRILVSEDWTVTDIYIGYICTLVLLNISYYVFGIIAAIKAYKGRMFYYWFWGNLCYQIVFTEKEESKFDKKPMNKPPTL